MFCPECGAFVKDGTQFCTHCGAAVEAHADQPVLIPQEPEVVAPPVAEAPAPRQQTALNENYVPVQQQTAAAPATENYVPVQQQTAAAPATENYVPVQQQTAAAPATENYVPIQQQTAAAPATENYVPVQQQTAAAPATAARQAPVVPPAVPVVPAAAPEKPKKKLTWLWILLALLLIGGIVAAVVLFMSDDDDSDKEDSAVTETAEDTDEDSDDEDSDKVDTDDDHTDKDDEPEVTGPLYYIMDEVRYYTGNSQQTRVRTVECNRDGLPVRFSDEYINEGYTTVTELEYNSQGNITGATSTTELDGTTWEYISELNSDGYLTKETGYRNGSMVSLYEYEHDSHGNLVNFSYTDYENSGNSYTESYKYEYDGENIVEQIYYRNGNPLTVSSYEYNSQDQVTYSGTTYKETGGSEYGTYTYNAEGLLTEYRVSALFSDALIGYYTYSYNDVGAMEQMKYYEPTEGSGYASLQNHVKFSYHEKGVSLTERQLNALAAFGLVYND